MGNNYEAWMDYESKWIAGYRRKLMRTTTHITIPITLPITIIIIFLSRHPGVFCFPSRIHSSTRKKSS